MKNFLIILISLFFTISAGAQTSKDVVKNIKKMADNIIGENIREFKDSKTGKIYTDIKGLQDLSHLQLKSLYSDWEYPSGVMNMAMLQMGALLKERKYSDYAKENFQFIFKNAAYMKGIPENRNQWNYPFGRLLVTKELDDCGAMGASLIDVYKDDKRTDYLTYINKAADHILKKQYRLADGTLCRERPVKLSVWADDLYMSVPFLSRMGELTGDGEYFDFAAKQVIQFTSYLWDENTGLYYHCWQSDDSTNGVAHWGRANGWVIVAQVELLKRIPKNHPQRQKLLEILKQQINGIARWQSESGLWYQLLDKQDSYLESSCTAMFTFGIAAAVNEGWIPERYINVALKGWQGLISKITDDGQLTDICVGTGIGDNLAFYYNRPAKTNDDHGTGAFIMAGVEIAKYLRNKDK